MVRITATAPGRCGILGNPSDIYGGKVLSCSVPARATCTISASEEWSIPEDRRLWSATQVRYPVPEPVAVKWETEIPRSSGLSGSTALLASILSTVMAFRGDRPKLDTAHERSEFAELVRRTERVDADIMCGYQDAYMIVHGGLQLMDFQGKHPREEGPKATLKRIEAPTPFLLVTTGVERLSGSVHGPLADRWLSGETKVRDSIAEISLLAEPGAEHLVAGRLGELGQLMNRNQELVASIGGSGAAVDELVSRCLESGALGAKLAGAGMGGTVIALTEDPLGLEQKLRSAGYSRFLRPKPVTGLSFVSEGNFN